MSCVNYHQIRQKNTKTFFGCFSVMSSYPNPIWGDQGWSFAGSCDGSVGPTSSPSFNSLAKEGGGFGLPIGFLHVHPQDHVQLPQLAQHRLLQPWIGLQAWDHVLKLGRDADGFVLQDMNPIEAPQYYLGFCKYNQCQCRMVTIQVGCNPGDASCSCTSGQHASASASCKKNIETEQCTMTNVEP